MHLPARVHEEGGAMWAEVAELPGCFASGETLDELRASVVEAVSPYLDDRPACSPDRRTGELRLIVPASA